MKSKTTVFLVIAFVFVCGFGIYSFKSPEPGKKEYMIVTTVESIIPGGIGRSKMLITKSDGTQSEDKMENFYSMVGINFGNISSNDLGIEKKLNELAKEGWTLVSVNSGSQSPSAGYEQGIFLSRYVLEK